MRSHLLIVLWPASACVSETAVVADMERAMRESNHGLVGALLAAEVLQAMVDPVDIQLRHSTENCGCPCISSLGNTPPFFVTLDYRTTGCLPDSGFIPTALSGHVYGNWDGTTLSSTTFGDLLLALDEDYAVSGKVEGPVSGSAGNLELFPVGTVSAGGYDIDVDLHITTDNTSITMNGITATRSPDLPEDEVCEVVFTDLVLFKEDIGAPCPRPAEGTTELVHPRGNAKDVSIAYAQPGDGFVTVTRGSRESEPTDFCAYKSELW